MNNTRSIQAALAEKITKRFIIPKGETLSEIMMEYRLFKNEEKQYSLPLLFKMNESYEVDQNKPMQVFYINKESTTDYVILYLHGGSYINEFIPFHWLMLNKIAENLKSKIVVPDYPLAPIHKYRESYQLLTELYQQLLSEHPDKHIIFMGDSAGGGLALGLAEQVGQIGLPQPAQLILLSPWIDLEMNNPEMEEYAKVDPTLKRDELLVAARYWADNEDLSYWQLSPINGDISCLSEVHLFVGTHEIFYPDIMKFYNMLQSAGIPGSVTIGYELNHVYPCYPIPEADEAIEHIIELITSKKYE